jgi:hypothetical protein
MWHLSSARAAGGTVPEQAGGSGAQVPCTTLLVLCLAVSRVGGGNTLFYIITLLFTARKGGTWVVGVGHECGPVWPGLAWLAAVGPVQHC